MSFNKRPFLLSAMFVGVLSLAGCANMVTTAANSAQNATISGTIHGGRQPIVGATVKLMAAGNAGYGSTATVVDSVQSGAGGGFSFSNAYTCPSTTSTTESQYLYITASGGQPTTGVTNTQAALMVALGPCATVLANNPSVDVDELTTIASITALQQFFALDTVNGLGNIGTTSTNLTGLANAMAVVPNMVNIASGQSFASTTVSGSVTGYTTNPVVIVTPEQTKLNTMADILAACINTGGSNTNTPNACNTLYANSGGSPADTVQAAYYMATIPAGSGTTSTCTTGTSVSTAPSICTLFGLVTSNSPYQSTLAAAPTDWTLGITYGSSSVSTASVDLMNKPYYLAIDGSGDVWIVNYSSTSATTNNSVTELGPTGTPMKQVLTTSLIAPSYIAIDPTGNVWVPSYGSNGAGTSVLEYTTGGTTNTFTTNAGPQKVAIDGQGNVYVLEPAYYGSGDIEEINAGSATGTTATTLASCLDTDFSNIVIDSSYTLWVTGGGSTTTAGCTAGAKNSTGYNGVFQYVVQPTVTITGGGGSGAKANATFVGGKLTGITLSAIGSGYTSAPTVAIAGGNGSGATATATITSGSVTSFTITAAGSGYVLPYAASSLSPIAVSAVTGAENAIGIDNSNNFFVQNYGMETYAELSGTTTLTSSTGNSPTLLTKPEFEAIDGAGDRWITNAASTGPVFELTSADTAISPTVGFLHTYYYPYGIAIDASGNVWVGSQETFAYTGYITEIVGAAVPVGTPMAADLPTIPGGTSKLGTTP